MSKLSSCTVKSVSIFGTSLTKSNLNRNNVELIYYVKLSSPKIDLLFFEVKLKSLDLCCKTRYG